MCGFLLQDDSLSVEYYHIHGRSVLYLGQHKYVKFTCLVSPKSHEMTVTFQRRFSVTVWCGLVGNKLIGLFVFGSSFTVTYVGSC